MTRRLHLTTLVFVGAVLIAPTAARAQSGGNGSFKVDEAKAKAGQKLYTQKACGGCHTIGKGRVAGPDLAGLLDRRKVAWVHDFLTNTKQMLATDATAKQLVKESKGAVMPDPKLSAANADALIHYMASESAKKKK
jgi:cytochrome c2